MSIVYTVFCTVLSSRGKCSTNHANHVCIRQLRKRIININLFSPSFWQAPQARPLWSLWWSCVLRNRGLPALHLEFSSFWATYQNLSQTACMNLWHLQTVASRQTRCKQLHCILVYCIHMYFWIWYILYIYSTYIKYKYRMQNAFNGSSMYVFAFFGWRRMMSQFVSSAHVRWTASWRSGNGSIGMDSISVHRCLSFPTEHAPWHRIGLHGLIAACLNLKL